MATLDHKIDFAVVFSVTKANPNGDPLNGNRPRQNYDGYGEVSDVALKRKIRNRLLDMEESIFVQSNDKKADGFNSLKERADANEELAVALKSKKNAAELLRKLHVEHGSMCAVSDKYLLLKALVIKESR